MSAIQAGLQFGGAVGIGSVPHAKNANAARARDGGCGVESIVQTEVITTESSGATTNLPAGLMQARAWLQVQITRGQHERFSWKGLVTPDMARAMLELNIGNRAIRAVRVNEHAKRLKNGTFILTHQGIAFSREGQLNDGQHRLTAISESDIPGMLTIWFGCERAEFAVVDQTFSRTAADILGIKGQTHGALRASICGMLFMLENEPHVFARPQEVADYAMKKAGPDLDLSCTLGHSMTKVSSPTALGLAHYWIATRSPNPLARAKLTLFWDGMASGANLTGPRLRMREWLMRGRDHSKTSQHLTIHRAGAVIETWNAWMANRKTVQLDWQPVTSLPQVKK